MEDNNKVEVILDARDTVTVSVDTFFELSRCKATVDIFRHVYLTSKYSSELADIAEALFGPKPTSEE